VEALKNRIPGHARDLKLNLASLASEAVLDEEKKAGTFVASAIASRNGEVIRAMLEEFGPRMDPAALKAAQAAAAVMAMNNVYYRFAPGGERGVRQASREAAHERHGEPRYVEGEL
jgi:alkyl hydroperoxide reductase subunit D